MRRETIPLSSLPAWSKINDVNFYDLSVRSLPGRGNSLVADKALNAEATFDDPVLISIPKDLVLSAETLDEYSRLDKHFRELRTSVAFTSFRLEAMLFLLYQTAISSPGTNEVVGVSNPWTQYANFLPTRVSVPTTWTEEQRQLLIGTSLELSIESKIGSLTRQFDSLAQAARKLSWYSSPWSLSDWILVDSLYRSRSLELPSLGECLVPCLDMANHSSKPNAFYDLSQKGLEVVLQIRPGSRVAEGEEITISYGENKSAAEMLFSYGFIDNEMSNAHEILLDISPDDEDPFGQAKVFAFPGPPSAKVSDMGSSVEWSSPFLHFMCLNEEDGLDFKVLQQVDGTRGKLQTFWQGEEVSSRTDNFEDLIKDHPHRDIFRLRCVALLQDKLSTQIERLLRSAELVETLSEHEENDDIAGSAKRLREMEMSLLEKALIVLEDEKTKLAQLPAVVAYLGGSRDLRSSEDPGPQDVANTEEELRYETTACVENPRQVDVDSCTPYPEGISEFLELCVGFPGDTRSRLLKHCVADHLITLSEQAGCVGCYGATGVYEDLHGVCGEQRRFLVGRTA